MLSTTRSRRLGAAVVVAGVLAATAPGAHAATTTVALECATEAGAARDVALTLSVTAPAAAASGETITLSDVAATITVGGEAEPVAGRDRVNGSVRSLELATGGTPALAQLSQDGAGIAPTAYSPQDGFGPAAIFGLRPAVSFTAGAGTGPTEVRVAAATITTAPYASRGGLPALVETFTCTGAPDAPAVATIVRTTGSGAVGGAVATSISPKLASRSWGGLIAVRGKGLSAISSVNFGARKVRPLFGLGSAATIAIAPPQIPGAYPVTVTTRSGETSPAAGAPALTYR